MGRIPGEIIDDGHVEYGSGGLGPSDAVGTRNNGIATDQIIRSVVNDGGILRRKCESRRCK